MNRLVRRPARRGAGARAHDRQGVELAPCAAIRLALGCRLSALVAVLALAPPWARAETGPVLLSPASEARYRFAGPLGERIDRNVTAWLLRAPQSNPGLLAMFAARDRQPPPELVPWAGEFVGKYLTSGVLALRMSDSAELRDALAEVVAALAASQADDGYLGPFPKPQRLLGNWDLWGHYHIIYGLLLWHEQTGDARALATARKAADLVCRTYLDAGRRVLSAGSPEMNLSVLHGLVLLYQTTGEARYLRQAEQIVADFEKAGDYLRSGLAGIEYFRSPAPRWESLHCLQGMAELYRTTGDRRYRDAFVHHWQSIRRYDRRNTGAFSSGEQATGDPFADTAIETCCTIAWMALSIDALRLTGDSQVADELELSTLNAVAGAQHPSGNWWTYDTPMNGRRAASAHTIVFQARPGTPELNCCSVNGPRGLGMLAQWAVMTDERGLAVNYYGPMRGSFKLADGTPIVLRQETDYPRSGTVTLRIEGPAGRNLPVRLRIPGWSRRTEVLHAGRPVAGVKPGEYLSLVHSGKAEDELRLSLDVALRHEPGARAQRGRASLYRGPLLLAFDPRFNPIDEPALPEIDAANLSAARVVAVDSALHNPTVGRYAPWLLLDVPTSGGGTLRLCDYGSAGSTGTPYRSWLKARGIESPLPAMRFPRDAARLPRGAAMFGWEAPSEGARRQELKLVIGRTADLAAPLVEQPAGAAGYAVLTKEQAARLEPGPTYYWRLLPADRARSAPLYEPPRRFTIDPARRAPADPQSWLPRGDGLLVDAPLAGSVQPLYGVAGESTLWKSAAGPDGQRDRAIELDGRAGLVRFELLEFPRRDYTLAVRARLDRQPHPLGQIASAWCAGSDDPLRLCVADGQLFARIEAGAGYSTPGVPVEPGRWYHLAVVKSGTTLLLFVDGVEKARSAAPAELGTSASDIALGGNPHYTGGPEFLAGCLANCRFYARALSGDEIRALAEGKASR